MGQTLLVQQWEPILYRQLNHFIKQAAASEDIPLADLNYMVFDFDETCIFGDIEENLMIYMMETLAYRLTPQQMGQLLAMDGQGLDQLVPGQTFSFQQLIEDILSAYDWLWQHYISQAQVDQFALVQSSEIYQAFCAKLLCYYQSIHYLYQMTPGTPVPTYWFTGYDEIAFEGLVKEMLDKVIGQPRQYRYYQTPPSYAGKCGVVATSYLSGLIFTPEMVDLFSVLYANRIIAYIVSASPQILVEKVLKFAPYQLSEESQVFGMRQISNQGGLTAQLSPTFPLTRREGKSRVIEEWISKRHGGKGPLAVFGDSMGDYHMLQHFIDTRMSVLMDRQLNDETQKLKVLAQANYGRVDARYFVQGRDSLEGHFIQSTISVS